MPLTMPVVHKIFECAIRVSHDRRGPSLNIKFLFVLAEIVEKNVVTILQNRRENLLLLVH
jgi:hypothetical protein